MHETLRGLLTCQRSLTGFPCFRSMLRKGTDRLLVGRHLRFGEDQLCFVGLHHAAHVVRSVRLRQKSQSSSSVFTALPITYDEPDPEKKSWFSSAFGESAERIAGFTSVTDFGNIGS